MWPGWPSHIGTNDESIFFCVDSSPFVLCLASWRASSRQCSPKRPYFLCILAKAGLQAQLGLHSSWRVVGRSTSLRLVQLTKVNSGISSTVVLQRSTLLSKRQLSHACAPIAVKCFGRASAVIPVELRQPGASSLVLACSVDPRGDGILHKVTAARLMHP